MPRCEATNLGAFDLCHFALLKRGCANSVVGLSSADAEVLLGELVETFRGFVFLSRRSVSSAVTPAWIALSRRLAATESIAAQWVLMAPHPMGSPP